MKIFTETGLIITLLCFLVFTFVPIDSAQSQSSQEEKPNVIMIHVDDLGYGDTGAYGAAKVRTPNIDRLAEEGRRFTDGHSASAVCSPSRYALMTGEYPDRKDLYGPLMVRDTLAIDTSQMTNAKLMKEAGYATGMVGKWHLGFQKEHPVDWNKELKPGPLELGFDYYFGVPVLNSHPPFVYVENHRVVGLDPEDPFVYEEEANTREWDEKFRLDAIGGAEAAHEQYKDREVGRVLAGKAVEWIKKHKDESFYMNFSPPQIHHPFTPAPRFIATSDAGPYGDFIHELDWMIGQVLDALDVLNLADNTLVILTSDNGGMFNRGGQNAWEAGHRLNGDLLGMKFGAWEGGHRVPFIVRWPNHVPSGTVSDELLSNVDILATLAALVNRPLRDGEGPDSYNMLPAFTGSPEEPIRDHLVISPSRRSHVSIRKGKWMYIPAQGEGGFGGTEIGEHTLAGAAAHKLTGQENSDVENGRIKEDAPPAQLYDLESDLSQKYNVYNEHPEVVEELQDLLDRTLNRK